MDALRSVVPRRTTRGSRMGENESSAGTFSRRRRQTVSRALSPGWGFRGQRRPARQHPPRHTFVTRPDRRPAPRKRTTADIQQRRTFGRSIGPRVFPVRQSEGVPLIIRTDSDGDPGETGSAPGASLLFAQNRGRSRRRPLARDRYCEPRLPLGLADHETFEQG